MTLWLIWTLLSPAMAADDCADTLLSQTEALQAAAVELDAAAGAMEQLTLEVDELDGELAEIEAEHDEALDLLQALHAAAVDDPTQPLGAYAVVLDCFFDEAACFEEPAIEAAADGLVEPSAAVPEKKKGLFRKGGDAAR